MLSLLSTNNWVYGTDTDAFLKKTYGDKYPLIYQYNEITLLDFKHIKPNISKRSDIKTHIYSSENPYEIVKKLLAIAEKFKYIESNRNPRILETIGGNCQAFSIWFKFQCDANKIPCIIDYTDTHMFNIIAINSEDYTPDSEVGKDHIIMKEYMWKVDIVEHTMESIEGGKYVEKFRKGF